jgi:hypothetical protein
MGIDEKISRVRNKFPDEKFGIGETTEGTGRIRRETAFPLYF